MKKNSRKSNLGKVQTVRGGGLSDQTPPPQPLQSLAPAGSPEQLLASPPQANTPGCTIVGDRQSNNGNRHVLTDKSVSGIPNSTLAGTVNWVLNMLQKRNLIEFGLVHGANDNYYQARFSTSLWVVSAGVLTLKAQTSEESEAK